MWRLIILALLVGCDGDPRTSNHITVENLPDDVTVQELETSYSMIGDCMKRTAHDKPLVVFFDGRLPDRPETALGEAWFESGIVWVRADIANRNRTIRHEFIHHILAWTGYPDDMNSNHDHPAWNKCG